jgi:hypothetical protein
MCRNIKKLRYPDRFPTEAELTEAALQYIRKVSGYRKPSRRFQPAFDRAVEEVAEASRKLFTELAFINDPTENKTLSIKE